MSRKRKPTELTEIYRTGRMSDVGNALGRRGALGPHVFELSPAGGLGLDAAIKKIHQVAETPETPKIDGRKRARITRAHARRLLSCFVDDERAGTSTLVVPALLALPDETHLRAVEGLAALLETEPATIQRALITTQDWVSLLERMDQEPNCARLGRRA